MPKSCRWPIIRRLANRHQFSTQLYKIRSFPGSICSDPVLSIQTILLHTVHFVAMSPEQHSSLLTSPGRLLKIDRLRERNIGAYLPLPQLVAVGDQSSGKSSLLESLTGIPFPRGQELCTRYATQITHRREASTRIDVTILPGPRASTDHKLKLNSYQRPVQTTAQLRTEFPDILTQVILRSIHE